MVIGFHQAIHPEPRAAKAGVKKDVCTKAKRQLLKKGRESVKRVADKRYYYLDPCRDTHTMKMRGGIKVRWVRARARLLPKLARRSLPAVGLASVALALVDSFTPGSRPKSEPPSRPAACPVVLTQGLD